MFTVKVKKRNGSLEDFEWEKIDAVVKKAFEADGKDVPQLTKDIVHNTIQVKHNNKEIIDIEDIQDDVVKSIIASGEWDVALAYASYREKHKELRFIKERVDWIDNYMESKENAATSSETDANANVSIKNVANIDGEVYKSINRQIQRYRMTKQLEKQFPEVAKQYAKDLETHIIYAHDEASSPAVKNYCEAVSLYPLLVEGTKGMDGLGTVAPKNLSSFCGQLVNLTFLLSAQCKGAVAFGEFFNFLDYFCIKDFGPNYHEKAYRIEASILPSRKIVDAIHQAYQQIVYGWNQPAGNRSYQSPFTNISYYDKYYWHALFDEFCFPDGTKPMWERVNWLQKDFMEWFNNERTKTLLTFPVETVALLSEDGDIKDKEWKNFTAEMYSKGHSFFTYISDNPNALASCCRLRNEIAENVFSFTNGLTGVQTGSANVITLNLNRIIQDWARQKAKSPEENNGVIDSTVNMPGLTGLREYLISILERVYKYHIAYKTLLYEVEDAGMLNASTAGYINMHKLFSTIGINGLNEAAEFVGIKCNYNEEYKEFCRLITGTISEQNKIHSTKDFQFNTELVPAEGLSSKNYNWDKSDGYWVPEDRNLYNSYFYIASDENCSVLDKFKLHGREFTELLDGGVGLHCNLEEHLSKKQYLKLIDFAIANGTSYFTFNIPNSECDDCHYISKAPIKVCPKCGSTHITWWTRVIGFLRPIKFFDKERYKEALTRVYSKKETVC